MCRFETVGGCVALRRHHEDDSCVWDPVDLDQTGRERSSVVYEAWGTARNEDMFHRNRPGFRQETSFDGVSI